MPNLIILLKADGMVDIDAIGFVGGACDNATMLLEKALGKVKNKTKKKEFYNIEGQKTTNQNKLRIR